MQRRRFLILGGVSMASVGLGLHEVGYWPGRTTEFSYWSLTNDVRNLYSPQFNSALVESTSVDLIQLLRQKEIIVGNQFFIKRVELSQADDPIIKFDRRLFTQTELTLYALVARLRSRSIVSVFE